MKELNEVQKSYLDRKDLLDSDISNAARYLKGKGYDVSDYEHLISQEIKVGFFKSKLRSVFRFFKS